MLPVCGFGFLMFYENNYKLLNLVIFGSNIADRVPHFSVQVVFINSGFTNGFRITVHTKDYPACCHIDSFFFVLKMKSNDILNV